MNTRNRKILNKAIELASLSKDTKFRLCAIITDKKDNILSIGFNSFVKTSPLQKKYAEKNNEEYKIFNHAEISAINKLPYGSRPFHIYVARINRKNQPLGGFPCRICRMAIEDTGIKYIFHT